MKNKYISRIINRYFKGRHSAETELKVQQWLLEKNNSEQKDEVLFDVWKDIKAKPNAEVYSSLGKVQQKLGMAKSRRLFLHSPLFRVAVLLLPFTFALSVYLLQNRGVEMIEVATIAGEQKEITLPDGSIVWMNACSRISYPEKFDSDLREVQLSGEALFSVTKDRARSFVVTAKEMRVEVLGTQFNVKSYPEDNITSTTLMSGAVEVTLENEEYLLAPNEEFVYSRSDKKCVVQESSDNTLLWREGVLMFSEITLPEIIKKLERQYSVKFHYTASDFSADNYSVKFSNRDSIEHIMGVMQDLVGSFSYSMKNNVITLKNTK